MPRIRIVHAADLHLDTPFEGIAGAAPHVAAALREASLQAWDDLVRFTIQQRAAALLLAGDLYDGAERGVRAQLRVLKGLNQLSSAGVQVFIVHGNHDPLDGWVAIREWPAGVHVFGSGEVEIVPILVSGLPVAFVHGLSYGRRDVTENLAARFRRTAEAAPQIGLLHANVGAVAEHAAYAPCSLADLERSGLDYWALGHVHKRQILRDGHPWAVYPGNLQGRSPKPSETGSKGALLIELDTEECRVEPPVFAPLDRIRFLTLDYDVAGVADIGALHAGLRDALEDLGARHAGRSLLVRVVLTGRADVTASLRRPDALSQFCSELRESFAQSTPFVWVESILNRGARALDIEAIRARGEFSAEVVQRADKLAASPDELSEYIASRCAQLEVGQIAHEIRRLPSFVPQDVLDEALAMALDRLERGGEA